MNTENSLNESEKQKNSLIRRMIIGGLITVAAAAILGGLYYFFFRIGDPPPIIVKTGSLIFQSEKQMKQLVLGNYTYVVEKFGIGIKGVKIKNIAGTEEDIDYEKDKDGKLEIEVTLQKFDGSMWVDFDTLFISAAGSGSQNDFKVITNVDLERTNITQPGYTDRWANSENYRFKAIKVRKGTVELVPPRPITVGNHYAICIYDSVDWEECKLQ